MNSRPESSLITFHFFHIFCLYELSYLLHIVTTVLLTPRDEITELLFRPLCEPGLQQILHLFPLFTCQRVIIILFSLLFLLMASELTDEFLLCLEVFFFLQ